MVKIAFILLLLSFCAIADTFQIKDWMWGHENERYLFAVTVNADNHTFGQYCYLDSKACVYLLITGIVCREGSKLTALINSDKGAKEVELLCRINSSGNSVYMVTPFDLIDIVTRQANYIAFAVPTSEADFQVARFSLAGSAHAIELMAAATEAIIDLRKGEELSGEILL